MSAAYLKVPAPHYEHKQGCTGKHAYISQEEARCNATVKRLKHEIYGCAHCGHWHTRGPKEHWRS